MIYLRSLLFIITIKTMCFKLPAHSVSASYYSDFKYYELYLEKVIHCYYDYFRESDTRYKIEMFKILKKECERIDDILLKELQKSHPLHEGFKLYQHKINQLLPDA